MASDVRLLAFLFAFFGYLDDERYRAYTVADQAKWYYDEASHCGIESSNFSCAAKSMPYGGGGPPS